MLKRLVTTGAVALALLALPSFVRADVRTDAAALEQFDAGRAAFARGEHARALASFTASIEALPSPNTRLYVARCQRALGKTASAYASYRLAAREAADRVDQAGEKRFAPTRDAAQAEAAEIEQSVPRLQITLPVDAPPGTTVRLDGAEAPSSALDALEVDPGTHTVEVAAPRRATFEQTIEVAQGERRSVEVVLARSATAKLEIALTTRPAGLAVELDGEPLEPSTVVGARALDPGVHTIVARAPGHRDFTWKETLAEDASRRVDVALEPVRAAPDASRGTPKWLFFGAAGLSVVTLGVGTYFALDASSRADAEKAKDPLLRDPSEKDGINGASTTANVLFVAGAAFAVGAGALALLTDWSAGAEARSGRERRIQPWFAGNGGGLAGSF